MKLAQIIKGSRLPAHEVEFIFEELLGLPRSELYQTNIRPAIYSSFLALEQRRLSGYPLQYLLGVAWFMGMKLKVVPGVFVPRPETEVLVDTVLSTIKRKTGLRVLDVGTGCGAIALALARERRWEIDGLDISSLAISVATENRNDLHEKGELLGRVRFVLGDFLEIESAPLSQEHYDVLVSNPPYIDFSQFPTLPEDVKKEPPVALFAGEGGNFFYRVLFEKGVVLLSPGGWLFMELPGTEERAEQVRALGEEGGFEVVKVVPDLNERPRVLVARRR